MSTPNFRTQSNFPLYLFDDSDMTAWEAQDYFSGVAEDLDEINDGLRFFSVSVEGGYYGGAQLYVGMTETADNAGFTEDGAEYADNESCRYYLDMYRSQAIRKFEAEQRKVNKLLAHVAQTWGFERYFCRAIFSNGEAIYCKADDTPRARILEAVSA